jgi:hypothetical protein
MHAAVALAFATALSPCVELPTLFWGIEPTVVVVDADTKLKAKQPRAVVLVHGLLPRVFHPDRAEKPEAHDWQVKDGRLVKALADEADVYGFSYAQTHGVDEVAYSRGLRDGIAAIRAAGYKEVVLVGHSCGVGKTARVHPAEDAGDVHPVAPARHPRGVPEGPRRAPAEGGGVRVRAVPGGPRRPRHGGQPAEPVAGGPAEAGGAGGGGGVQPLRGDDQRGVHEGGGDAGGREGGAVGRREIGPGPAGAVRREQERGFQ